MGKRQWGPDFVLLPDSATAVFFSVRRSIRLQLKSVLDPRRYGSRSGFGDVDQDPVSFALSQYFPVRHSCETILPCRPDSSPVHDPCRDLNLIAGQGGAEIFNVVGPGYPGAAEGFHLLVADLRAKVSDGNVLHPLDVSHVIHMSVAIDDFIINNGAKSKNCVCRHRVLSINVELTQPWLA